MPEIAGYTLPAFESAAADSNLQGIVSKALQQAWEKGGLTTTRASRLVFLAIDTYYKLPTSEPRNTDLRIWRFKVFARLQFQFGRFFPDAILNPNKFDNYTETVPENGVIENIKNFTEAFGEEASETLAPNIPALKFVIKNAWWIVPAAGAIWLAPTIISTLKK